LPYTPLVTGEGSLRPEIQIETAVWPLRLPSVELSGLCKFSKNSTLFHSFAFLVWETKQPKPRIGCKITHSCRAFPIRIILAQKKSRAGIDAR
jgi:hypothetical protein